MVFMEGHGLLQKVMYVFVECLYRRALPRGFRLMITESSAYSAYTFNDWKKSAQRLAFKNTFID